MSETTKTLRAFQTYSVGACGVRDLAADAIEAVEAQVAAQAKRHEDLAAWCAETEARVEKLSACVTATDDSLSDWAERHEKVLDRLAALEEMGRLGASPNGDDRTRGDMSPRGFDSPTPAAPTPPAPSAVPAPRGFRVGDVYKTGMGHTVTILDTREDGQYFVRFGDNSTDWHPPELFKTLVRAADAPEAPAEEDTGLVVQRIRDEATKPLHVQIEKLRAKLAETERECAEQMSGVATKLQDAGFNNVENLVGAYRFERAQADALRAKLAAAEQALDVERRTGLMRVHGDAELSRHEYATYAERVADTLAVANANAACRKERDALRADLAALKAKPRFRTRPVTAADVRALDDEWAKSKYVGRNSWVLAMRALGFRRRVDGAK